MPMSQHEASALLRYLQGRAREAGLADFDDVVVSDMRREDLPPARMLLFYLEVLDAEFSPRSYRAGQLAVERLNGSCIPTSR